MMSISKIHKLIINEISVKFKQVEGEHIVFLPYKEAIPVKENHYECLVKTSTHSITLNVFTNSNDVKVIRELAIKEAIRHLKEFGREHQINEIKPISAVKKLNWIFN